MKPTELNFKMPPEWATHQRTFLEWPVQEACCYPESYDQVCQGFAEIAKAIATFEPVTMLTNHDTVTKAIELCGPTVDVLELEHNDSWMRDNGPTFVVNEQGEIAGINWMFNAWGEKYPNWEIDNEVAPKLLDKLGVPVFHAPFVLEGGSIHVDGEGTLLTTEECLLNKNRNPRLDKEAIELLLQQYLDIKKIIWLRRGLDGDETDGHVDNVACFAKPGTVILQTCDDPADPNFEITQENRRTLRDFVDAQGRKLEIIEIPQPPQAFHEETRLTLSYLNFYFVNNGIILPVFGGPAAETDKQAIEILQRVFPDRQVVPIDGMPIIAEGGNIHCITQQMPAGVPAKL